MFQKKRWQQYAALNIVCLTFNTFNLAFATVVTSIRPLGFIAAAITEGVTPTKILLPNGASPHDYALRPSDLTLLRDADLVIWIGPDMESFLSKPLTRFATNKQIAIAQLPKVEALLIRDTEHDHPVSEQVTTGKDDHHHHHHGDYNMHLWLSPPIAKLAAITIHDKLLELMPQNRDKLDENLRQFKDQLAQREEKIAKMLKPIQNKGYFVFHDAYGYFEERFGLTPLGHFTVNPAIQPGVQRLDQIKTQLLDKKATCIFAEPQFRPAVINAIVEGTDVRVRIGMLDPLGGSIELHKDSYVEFLSQLSNQYLSCLK
ncbi:zinc ABC transporter substrate-binding protein ZnuA [Candidatus Regiella insecticola]|uniref:High-affinity zinc uptake system protein ZnuA n=1 Tax=Candidatus Regiella insecticola TaxID=138073 RepID=A0A6L2ZN82_9ENTR|nr:zinc ABC transporter substrate-binding protein ZnuA [Candidatus Regiella insecticola]GFN46216.1 ABC-type Zn2+ transport system periplasmic component/surface adhesin [Candidatus Regiella insecticola]